MKSFFRVILLLFLLFQGLFANWNKIENLKVAVLDFRSALQDENVDLQLLTEILQTDIVSKKYFSVVERERLNSLIKEQKLSLTGMIDDKDAAQLGNLVGAQKVILGSISKLGSKYYLIVKGLDASTGTIDVSVRETLDKIDQIGDVMPKLVRNFLNQAGYTSAQGVKGMEGDKIEGGNLNLPPENAPIQEKREFVNRNLERIKMLVRDNKFDKAIEEIDMLINNYPGFYFLYNEKAIIFRQMGRGDLADKFIEEQLKKINERIKSEPDNPILIEVKMSFLMQLRRFDEALKEIDEALKKDKNRVELNFYKANILLEKGDLNNAEKEYLNLTKMLEKNIKPEDNHIIQNSYYNLGKIYFLKKDKVKAENFFKKAEEFRHPDARRVLEELKRGNNPFGPMPQGPKPQKS